MLLEMNCGSLKNIIGSIFDVASDVLLECSPTEGISMQAMDSSHVCLVCLSLGVGCFSKYSCPTGVTLGISLRNLHKILSIAQPGDLLRLLYYSGSDYLEIEITGGRSRCGFRLSLMYIDCDALGVEDVAYNAEATMDSKRFNQSLRNISGLSDRCVLTLGEEGVTFSCLGDIAATLTVLGEEGAACCPPCSAEFAVRFLILFSRAQVLSPSVCISLGKETPLRLRYEFCEGAGSLTYHLAAIIND